MGDSEVPEAAAAAPVLELAIVMGGGEKEGSVQAGGLVVQGETKSCGACG